MDDQVKGLLITTVGVLLVVPDSLFVRLIDAEPMVTAFWRAMIAGILVSAYVTVNLGPRAGFRIAQRTGWTGLLYACLIGTTVPAFVLAVVNTSVANVVFIFASMPVFAAIFSRLFLGESIGRRMVITMVAVMCGLVIIGLGSSSTELASWRGDIWALYVSMAFAGALTAARKTKADSMIPILPLGFFGAAALLQLFTNPLHVFDSQWPLLISHGALIGAGSCLLALGPRFISSAEVALLVLLESVLAPILVWCLIDEYPGTMAIAGGLIVIASLLVSNAYSLSRPIDRGQYVSRN